MNYSRAFCWQRCEWDATVYISVIPGEYFCSGPLPLSPIGHGERWGMGWQRSQGTEDLLASNSWLGRPEDYPSSWIQLCGLEEWTSRSCLPVPQAGQSSDHLLQDAFPDLSLSAAASPSCLGWEMCPSSVCLSLCAAHHHRQWGGGLHCPSPPLHPKLLSTRVQCLFFFLFRT